MKKIFAMVVLMCALVVALGPISGCPKGTSKKDTAATGATITTETPKTDTKMMVDTGKKTDMDTGKKTEATKTDAKTTDTATKK